MLTSELIKQKAIEYGASVCGVGTLDLFEGEDPSMDPRSILPNAKTIVGFGFAVPRGLYHLMASGTQHYGYTTLGVKYIDEQYVQIFLSRICRLIEDAGYDACLQRSVPNLRRKGDKTTNPEVADTYELIYASAVAPGKPVPDVMIDFGKAAKACGLGAPGLSGHILSPKYGPFIRWAFLITDAPLETDMPAEELCDHCGLCAESCPGHAIDENGLDSWQCAVYYKGAHRSNPFMPEDFLAGHPEREAILNGEKRFDAESARALYPKLHFLPDTQSGYSPCLCGKCCDIACWNHLKEEGKL
ncbi:MAG: 4Fe-4S binding protein [Oscillospiraceae bacterium]|nr:4Fe-4S binding protein [Oscillospiraceae bacterium]